MRRTSLQLLRQQKSPTGRPAKRFSKVGFVKVVSVAAALLLLAAACSSDTDSDGPDSDSAATDNTATDDTASDNTAPDNTTTTTTDQDTDSSASSDNDRGLGVPQSLLDQLEECGNGSLCGEVPGEDGESVRYRLVPANGSEPPAGLIAFHFGGPGTNARETIRFFGDPFSGNADLVGRFDVLGVEQRGTDSVDGVDCGNDALFHRIQTGVAPLAERPQLVQQWVSGCPTGSYGSATAASDTAAVLRHLDAGRSVFVGYSYGGVIAVLLGQDHADAVDAIYMDSPSTGWLDPLQGLAQTVRFNNAFERFLANCDETRDCRFAPDGNAAERFGTLADTYEVPGDLLTATVLLLYSEESGPDLDLMFATALDGDYSFLTAVAGAYHQREGESYPPSAEIFPLVACADGIGEYTDDYNEVLDDLRAIGVLGELVVKGLPVTIGICDAWAGEADPFELSLSQSEVPVLLVASTNDPAVPWESVKPFIETSLPEQSAAVVENNFTHVLWRSGNSCLDAVVEAFIFDSTLPTISSPAGYESCADLEAAGS